MYIKQVVIDGFKSYAQRTEIVGFDPLFNAITGLNGSGKSNILDAICFLLGISNLSQVLSARLRICSITEDSCTNMFWGGGGIIRIGGGIQQLFYTRRFAQATFRS